MFVFFILDILKPQKNKIFGSEAKKITHDFSQMFSKYFVSAATKI